MFLDAGALPDIRRRIAEFMVSDVISPQGEFHYRSLKL
jgi:hypothetical protein